jgi:hypothetical protein
MQNGLRMAVAEFGLRLTATTNGNAPEVFSDVIPS